jgi:hypothetical protein
MTLFLDLRIAPVGGELATAVSIHQGTSIGDYAELTLNDLLGAIQGRHVLLAAHGFNVNRPDGIHCLSNWESLLQLKEPSSFIGLLWPGDSIWAHGLDYPDEPKVADDAGAMLAVFLNANFQDAASISFASHSLGARVVLSAISQLRLPVRGATLMAPAIDDNCLATDFQAAASKVGSISVLASKKDRVLSAAFPLGNLFAGIIDEGHPWWRAALGHCGPAKPWPANFQLPYQLPDDWNYQHGDYLAIDVPQPNPLPLPVDVPPQGTPPAIAKGWQAAFSSAFTSTRFR